MQTFAPSPAGRGATESVRVPETMKYICWARYLLWGTFIVLGILSLLSALSGCGATGDLYLPPDQGRG